MHRIGLIVFPDFYLMGFSAITAFELANFVLGETAYDVTVLSETGGMVTASAGVRVDSRPLGDDVFDTVLIASGVATDTVTPALESFIRHSVRTSRRIAAPCTGAFFWPMQASLTAVARRLTGALPGTCNGSFPR